MHYTANEPDRHTDVAVISAGPTNPLADLCQSRGWIACVPEAELWDRLRRVRWAAGLRCPHCGETTQTCLAVLDMHYRGGLRRYRSLVCYLAGDQGEGGILCFRLLRGAIYQARPTAPIALRAEDIVAGDGVYLTAGLKGAAGN